MILALILALQESESAEFGRLRFRPPEGWTYDRNARLWTGESAFFAVLGPKPLKEEPVEDQFARFEGERGIEVERRTKPVELPLTSGLPAHVRERRLRDSDSDTVFHSWEVMIRASDGIYCFKFGSSDEAVYDRLRKSAWKAVVDSVTEKPAQRLGFLLYDPPPGWTREKTDAANTHRWSRREEGELVGQFFWIGPAAATDAPLAEQFETFQKPQEYVVKKKLDAEDLELPSGLPAAQMARVVAPKENAKLAIPVYEALVRIGNQLYYCIYLSGLDGEGFQRAVERVFLPMLRSVRRGEAPGRVVERFCYRFRFPESWKDGAENQPAFLFVLKTRRNAVDYPIDFPILVDVRIGKISDARKALESWLSGRTRPMLEEYDSKVESRRFYEFEQEAVAGGGKLSFLKLTEIREGSSNIRDKSALRAFLLERDGFAVFVGTAFHLPPSLLGDGERTDAGLVQVTEICREIGPVLRTASFQLPPAREQWAEWLVGKGSYFYFYENVFGGIDAPVIARSLRMKFHEDRTCDVEQKKFISVPVIGDDWQDGSLDGVRPQFDTLQRDGGDRIGKAFFEVRGKSEQDLWIVLHEKTGRTAFYRMEPNAKRKVFGKDYVGLVIEGELEGRYELGRGYRIYTPPGK